MTCNWTRNRAGIQKEDVWFQNPWLQILQSISPKLRCPPVSSMNALNTVGSLYGYVWNNLIIVIFMSWFYNEAISIRGLCWSDNHRYVLFGSQNVSSYLVKQIKLQCQNIPHKNPDFLCLQKDWEIQQYSAHVATICWSWQCLHSSICSPPYYPLSSPSPNPSAPWHLSLHLDYFPFRIIKEKVK